MPLEGPSLPLDDSTHQELDKGAGEDADPLQPNGARMLFYAYLLGLIVGNCNEMLDPKYLSIEENLKLINAYPELQDMLSSAWEKKAYRDIRNLVILRSAASYQKQYLQSASKSSFFKGEYRGAAADNFYQYLMRNEKLFNKPQGDENYHAKLCTVIQSSGTGKSRMLTELGKRDVIVIYMNIHDKSEDYYFPPRDDIPADIVTGFVNESEGRYEAVCYNFFIALFNTVEEYLSDFFATENAQACILEWRKQMCDMSYPPTTTARADFFEKLGNNYNKADNRVGDVSYDDLCVESARRLSALLDRTFPDHSFKPKLVIAIDDAHTLTRRRGYLPAEVFRNVVKWYSHYVEGAAVWVVLASADSKIADFSPPIKLYGSGLVPLVGAKLFPPFTQLGWDQNASPIDKIDVEKVSLTEHIAGYGRPLWLSLKSILDKSKNVLDLTSAKLCGRWYNPADADQVLVVLGQRFAVNVTFGHPSSVEHLEKGMAGHLRICLATTMNRKWWFTSYPSEPFLSCAAAINLHRNDRNLGASLEMLTSLVNEDMIDLGRCGELISRILWLVAKDLYIRKHLKLPNEFPSQWDEHLIDCRMISVVDWLEFVFGPQIWGEENSEASHARKTFENAYLNFSHWVCMDTNLAAGDEYELPLDLLTLRLWQRTSAVQWWQQQPLVHKVIPMYFKDESISSTKGRMSQIFISDSICEFSDSKAALTGITRRHESIGGDASTLDSGSLPYIAIMADLGQAPSFSVSFTEGDIGDRCLRIYAAGVETSTYPFLDAYQQVMKTLQDLVQVQKIPETERPYKDYLDVQMKFGSTATATHMEWERGKTIPGKLARGASQVDM